MGKDEQTYANCQKVKSYLKTSSFFILFISFFISGCSFVPVNVLLMKDPLSAEEHNNLGVAYENEGKYELALREYKKAFDKDSNLIVPLVNIGNVYLKQGNYSESEKYYLKVLGRDQFNLEAANNLASLYLIVGKDYERGLEILTSAIAYNDGFPPQAMDTMGALYSRLGNTDKAKFFLYQACKKAMDDKELKVEINKHLKELGEGVCK